MEASQQNIPGRLSDSIFQNELGNFVGFKFEWFWEQGG